MKKITKVLSLVLVAVMLLGMTSVLAGAAENGGKITINNTYAGETYSIIKLFDANVSADGKNIVYTGIIPVSLKAYFETNESGNIVATDAAVGQNGELSEAAVKAMTAWAKEQGIPAENQKVAETAGGSVVFENLPYGYYVVLTTMGAAISVDSTNKEAVVNDKNNPDTIDKEVLEDSTNAYGDSASAQIGQEVTFKLTVTAKKNTVKLVAHDLMSEGLTLNKDSFVISVGDTSLSNDSYVLYTTPSKEATFTVEFTETYLSTIEADTAIEIVYKATINEMAKVYNAGNPNTAWLTYGNKQRSDDVTVQVYVYTFDLVKVDGSDKLLADAEFELYNVAEGGEAIKLVDLGDGQYRIASANDATTTTTIKTLADKVIKIIGVDSDKQTTYYLKETKAPDGYNLLPDRVPVQMMPGEVSVAANLDATMQEDGVSYKEGGVKVVNKAGVVLPETGGMGTTMFILFGSMIALAAAVVLVARKKAAGYR